MSNLHDTRQKCHSCIDNFMNRTDLSEDYKKRRVGQAISYMKSSKKTYGQEGYQGPYIKDDLGRCHAEKTMGGYWKGMFVPCPNDNGTNQSNGSRSRERVGQARSSSRDRSSNQGYQGPYVKDNLGRCHAEKTMDGYRAGMFIPCPNANQGSRNRL